MERKNLRVVKRKPITAGGQSFFSSPKLHPVFLGFRMRSCASDHYTTFGGSTHWGSGSRVSVAATCTAVSYDARDTA